MKKFRYILDRNKDKEIEYSTGEILYKFQDSLNKINDLFNQIKSELE